MVVVALLLCQARHTDTEHDPELSISGGQSFCRDSGFVFSFLEFGFYFLLAVSRILHHIHQCLIYEAIMRHIRDKYEAIMKQISIILVRQFLFTTKPL